MKSKTPCVVLAALLFIPGLAFAAGSPQSSKSAATAPQPGPFAGATLLASALPPGTNPSTPSGSATPGTPTDTQATTPGARAEQTPKASERKRSGKASEASGITKRKADKGKTRQNRSGASGTR